MEEVRETNNEQRKKSESPEAQELNTSSCKKILQLLGRQYAVPFIEEVSASSDFISEGRFLPHNELINNKFEK